MKRNILIGSLVWMMIFLGVLITACEPATQPEMTVSDIVSNTATLSPTPSPTETATKTPTPIPKWEVVATFGNGVMPQSLYSEDGSKVVVYAEHTLTILDAKTLTELSSLKFPVDSYNELGSYLKCINSDASLAVLIGSGIIANAYYVVDLTTGDIFREVYGFHVSYSGFIFSPDNESLFYNVSNYEMGSHWDSLDQVTRVNGGTNEWEKSYYSNDEVLNAFYTNPALTNDGTRMAAGYSNDDSFNILIWDVQTKSILVKIENQPAEITDVAFSMDGKWLASVGEDAILRIWDANNGYLIKKVTGFADSLSGVQFSVDGNHLWVYYNHDWQRYKVNLHSWQITDDTITQRNLDFYTENMLEQDYLLFGGSSNILFSPDGKKVAVAEGNIQIWDVNSQQIEQILTTDFYLYVTGMAYSVDGSQFAVRTYFGNVFVWEVESGELVLSISGNVPEPLRPINVGTGFGSPKHATITFSSDGNFLVIPNDLTLEVWDIANQEINRTFKHESISSTIEKLSLSDDGRMIYGLFDDNNRLAVWDYNSGNFLYEKQVNQYEDGLIQKGDMLDSMIAVHEYSLSEDENDLLSIINVMGNDEYISKEMISIPINCVYFSTDGEYIAIYSGTVIDSPNVIYQLDIRKTADLSLIASQEFDFKFDDITLSKRGEFLATTRDGKVTIYSLSDFIGHVNEADFSSLPEPILPTASPTSEYPIETSAPLIQIQTLQVPTESEQDITTMNAVNLHELGQAGLGKVQSVTWQTNGDLKVVSTKGIFMLDGQTLDVLQQYPISDLNITAEIESNGSPLVAGDIPFGEVQVWDGNTGEIIHHFENGSQPAISPNGKWLAYVVDREGIDTWNLHTNQAGSRLNMDYLSISQLVFSPDSRTIATALDDRSIRIWDVDKGIAVDALGGPLIPVTDFSFSNDGKYIVAVVGGSVWWWNLVTDEANHLDLFDIVYNDTPYGYGITYPDAVTTVSINSTNTVIAIGTNQREILFYDMKKGEFKEFVLNPNTSAMKLGFNTSNTKLYSVDADGQLVIWDLKDGSRLAQNHIFIDSIHGLVPHENGQISVWSENTLWTLNEEQVQLQDEVKLDVKKIFNIDPTGEYVVGGTPHQVSIYNAEDGGLLFQLQKRDQRELYGAVFTAEGTSLAVYGKGGIWFFDGNDFAVTDYYDSYISLMGEFSQDGELFLFAESYGVTAYPQLLSTHPTERLLFDTFIHFSIFFNSGDNILVNRISPDKSKIIVSSVEYKGDILYLIQISTSEILVEKVVDYKVLSVAYNPSGTLIAVGLEDGSVLLLDGNTLETMTALQAHTAGVNHLVFTVNGEKLITAAEDGVVKEWGVK